MNDLTRARWAAVTSGPISMPGTCPGPTFRRRARSSRRGSSASALLPTATSTEMAMQRSPAEPYAAPISASAARSMSASGITTMWFLAPPSACTRLPRRAAASWTCRATGVDPTNETARTSGCASSASTATRSPCTTLNTPSGRPASRSSPASISDGEGSRSEGLSTKVLPHTSASGNIHIGTITGKLNGVMPAATPSGWRRFQLSMPPPTLSECSARQQPRRATGELHDLDAAGHLAVGIGEHLAVLAGDGCRESCPVLLQQFAEAEHDARASQRRGLRPRGECRSCRRHRAIHQCRVRPGPPARPPRPWPD